VQFNAEQFCIDFNIDYRTEGKNVQAGWVNICCPACNDQGFHGGINPEKDYFNCWRCGWIPINEVLSAKTGLSKKQISLYKKKYIHGAFILSKNKDKVEFASKVELPGSALNKFHKKYLEKRGFDADFLEDKYKLLGTGISGYWKYRIIIPIYYRHQLISFQGRDYTNQQELRYVGLQKEKSVMDYKDILYGIDFCTSDTIAVVEGVTDVWRMGDGFAATFGTSMTENQIRVLSKYKNIYFLFDPELEAQEKAKKAATKLASIGRNVEIIDLEIDCDPGDLTQEESTYFRKLLGF
jgi:hypothetical protein